MSMTRSWTRCWANLWRPPTGTGGVATSRAIILGRGLWGAQSLHPSLRVCVRDTGGLEGVRTVTLFIGASDHTQDNTTPNIKTSIFRGLKSYREMYFEMCLPPTTPPCGDPLSVFYLFNSRLIPLFIYVDWYWFAVSYPKSEPSPLRSKTSLWTLGFLARLRTGAQTLGLLQFVPWVLMAIFMAGPLPIYMWPQIRPFNADNATNYSMLQVLCCIDTVR